MHDAPLPDLILYGRPGCGLCDEARELLTALLDARSRAGLRTPVLVERDIGGRRVELATSAARLRRLLDDVLDAA